jgi:hypothetical protein
VADFENEGDVAHQALMEVVEAAGSVCIEQAEQAVAKEVAAVAIRAEHHEAAMALLGSEARNAANIVVQEHRSTTAATREAAATAIEAATVDAAAANEASEKTVCDKAYHAANDAEEEGDCVSEAAALAMAWGLLGKDQEEDEDEEDHWQVQTTYRMSAARGLARRNEELSPARQVRAATSVAVLRDEARLAGEAASGEAGRRAH